MYRALKTLQERKTAFNKYIEQEARREKEQQQETEKRVREEFLNLLSESSSIRVTTRYRKAATLHGLLLPLRGIGKLFMTIIFATLSEKRKICRESFESRVWTDLQSS
jgi:hypothetical protein